MRKFTAEHRENLSRAIRGRKKPIGSGCGLPKNKPEDVWKKIDKRGPDDCWNWTAAKQGGGYGAFRIEGKYYKAHRVVYSLVHEPIDLRAPEDKYSHALVLHHCDNPSCCNPKHLFLGDLFYNARDKVARNRSLRGGNRKLNAKRSGTSGI